MSHYKRRVKDFFRRRSYMGVIERGKGNPTVKMIVRIANKLGVRTKDLFDF